MIRLVPYGLGELAPDRLHEQRRTGTQRHPGGRLDLGLEPTDPVRNRSCIRRWPRGRRQGSTERPQGLDVWVSGRLVLQLAERFAGVEGVARKQRIAYLIGEQLSAPMQEQIELTDG